MNWRALTIVLSAGLASAASAETIVARSGEHDGFSRLVMRLPEGADWSLTQNGTGANLKIDVPDVIFDTSQVFGLIPRTRLKNLSQTAAGQPLKLELGCECQLASHVMSNGYLVVDIRGEPSEAIVYQPDTNLLPLLPAAPPNNGYRFALGDDDVAASRFATDLASALATEKTIVRPSKTQEKSDAMDTMPEAGEVLAEAMSEPADEPAPTGMSLQLESDLIADSDLLDMEEAARAAAVNESERRLLQQIGRASNQGLLELMVSEVESDLRQNMLDPLGRSDRPMNPLDHLSITTAIDRETGLVAQHEEDSAHNLLCFANTEVAVHKWGSDDPFAAQISRLRNGLVMEFDKFDEGKLLKLAKTYLYFGFGAEARAMLSLLPKDTGKSDNIDVLFAMADILDGHELPINNVFSGQQKCEGHAALWSALADREIKKNANTDAIQQAYAMMPVHLRVHLGPQISTFFSHLGEKHMAEAALRSIERTGVEDVPDINLAEAALAELEGDTVAVAQELEEEVAEGSENTPQALIDLINLHFQERRALSPDVPEIVASYEVENRDADFGPDLRAAEIKALALEGRFQEAFMELERLKKHDGDTAHAMSIVPVMTLLTERASDVDFLHYALTFANSASQKETAAVADSIARRLLDLGFASHAQKILVGQDVVSKTEQRQMMLAEAALALGEPAEAIAELENLEGSKANRLRAQAYLLSKDYNQASEYFMAEQETQEATRGYWLSENYQAISGVEEGYGAVASVTTEIDEIAQDPVGMPPLAEARALVETSVGTRNRIEELLRQVSEIPES